MEREEFLKAVDSYYISDDIGKDKVKLLQVVKNRLNEFDYVEKRENAESAIREYLKAFHGVKVIPDEVIECMMKRIEEPYTNGDSIYLGKFYV